MLGNDRLRLERVGVTGSIPVQVNIHNRRDPLMDKGFLFFQLSIPWVEASKITHDTNLLQTMFLFYNSTCFLIASDILP
jgi:hypothetical protein